MIGERFSRWMVLELSRNDHGKLFYKCECDCGVIRDVRKDQLVRGVSKSCGCLKAEVAAEQIKRLSITHGASQSRTYKIWKGMRKRCNNPSCKQYKHYGGRGIKVCERWGSFESFLADMGECPPHLSIDRIDVNGDYSPDNCRWATKKQQMNNTQVQVLLNYRGDVLTIAEWADKLGVPYHRLYQRIFKLKWPLNKALELR